MSKEEIEKVERLMLKWVKLSDHERKFIQGLYKIRFGKFDLTEKQKAWLNKIE